MKRAIWTVVCALLAAGSLRAAEPEGLGDLRWGDPAPKGGRFTQNGDSQVRSERVRGRTFGSVRLERIEYESTGDRLVGVALFVKGRSGFLALKKDLEARFEAPGAPTAASPASESYRWNGKVTCADLHYLGEGVLSVLFLSWAPAQGTPGAPAASAEERTLQSQLRLCAYVAEALDKNIGAEQAHASELDSANNVVGPPPGGCGGSLQSTRIDPERLRIGREQETTVEGSRTAASERGRLQKEMERLKAELDALRAARAASAQSGASPAAPVTPPPAP